MNLYLVNKFVALNLSTRNWLWQQIGIIQVLNRSSEDHAAEIIQETCFVYH